MTTAWAARIDSLRHRAAARLFFVGGAPRSGTTWLQRLLNSHPDICCQGEGLFPQHLADPLAKLVQAWREALTAKNQTVFRESAGYPLPDDDDTDTLLGTAILLALDRQAAGRAYRAIGEKTPENVFLFPRLKRLFPTARLIVIARDPRDVLCSAWHFFHRPTAGENERTAKLNFIRLALPSLQAGTRATIDLAGQYGDDCRVVVYERMLADPATITADLYRFLGVSDDDATVRAAVAATSFAALTGGRPAGTAADGSFLRAGVAGSWRTTFDNEMNALILGELGWSFPHFGWQA